MRVVSTIQELEQGAAARIERRTAARCGTRRFEPLVSVVIPARNERDNIGWVLERLPAVHELILVDGRSTDDTVAVVESLWPGVTVLTDNGLGKGEAMRLGFEAASGHIIVALDADGSMDPYEIPRFIDAIVAGHDLAKGSRMLPGGGSQDLSRLRSAGNRGLCGTVNRLYGASFTDLCYGYVALRRSCLEALTLRADGFEIETEIVVCALKAKLRIVEVPSFELARRHGSSNLHTMRDGTRVLATMLRRRVAREPVRIVNPWALPASVSTPLVPARDAVAAATVATPVMPALDAAGGAVATSVIAALDAGGTPAVGTATAWPDQSPARTMI